MAEEAALGVNVSVRPAREDEGGRLKEIAIGAKGFWGYERDRVLAWADKGDFTLQRLRELIVFGTSIYPDSQYDQIWRFLRRHGLRPSQVVTDRFPIEEGARAFHLADTATAGKVCFTFA